MHQQNITLRSKIVSLLNAVTDPQMTKKNKRNREKVKKIAELLYLTLSEELKMKYR